MRGSRVLIPAAFLLCAGAAFRPAGLFAQAAGSDLFVGKLCTESKLSGGVCVIIEPEDTALAEAFARRGSFPVEILLRRKAQEASFNQQIAESALSGSITCHPLQQETFPYPRNFVTVLVVEKGGLPVKEAFRVLQPHGVLLLRAKADSTWKTQKIKELSEAGFTGIGLFLGALYLKATKPWPPEIDSWGHWRHGPDGNPVSRDTVVAPPGHLQWVEGPLWLRAHDTDSSISMVVTAGGRIFAFVDEAPISLVGNHALPDKWFLVARNAFNGVLLWKVPISAWGWRQWKSSWFLARPGDIPLNRQMRMVATEDVLYVTLGYRAPVSALDACTGKTLRVYPGTKGTREIVYRNGVLYLAVPAEKNSPGCRITALRAESGQVLWKSKEVFGGTTKDYVRWREAYGGIRPANLDSAFDLAVSEKALALIDGSDIVALDPRTGALKWRTQVAPSGKPLWLGALIIADGVVIHGDQRQLSALAAEDGKILWTKRKSPLGHLWYEWKDVWVINGLVWTWSPKLESARFPRFRSRWPASLNGYDLRTGELKRRVALGSVFKTYHHHRCYRDPATPNYVLTSRRGTEYISLRGGPHTIDNWVRGACHVGMLPANGLQYAPSHPCRCYIREKLSGFLALAPRGGSRRKPLKQETVFERGPAFGAEARGKEADPAVDWPLYRHDPQRSGSIDCALPSKLQEIWSIKLGAKLSPPVAVGDTVYLASVEERKVFAVSASEGKVKWEFLAGGCVDTPPSYTNGLLLFGSSDGWIYCLRAQDGALVWKFRAAPSDRKVYAFGHISSAWPVHGSVLLWRGRAYAVAGRSSHLDGGLHVFAFRPRDGKILAKYRFQGPSWSTANAETNYGLPEGALADILVADGDEIYMRGWRIDPELTRARAQWGTFGALGGFLDDTYFQRAYWYFGDRKNFARIIVFDSKRAYLLRMWDRIHALDPKHFFTPGKDGYKLIAQDRTKLRRLWKINIPIRVRAMAAAKNHIVVAGPPDLLDPEDPLGAFEGRKGGKLAVFTKDGGERKLLLDLSSPPVFDGLIVQRSRLFLCTLDGKLHSFASKCLVQ